MFVWKGNIDKAIVSENYPVKSMIQSFIITNKSNNDVTLNIKIGDPNQEINISPYNMQLLVGESITGSGYIVLRNEHIYIDVTGGNIDYYFIINELEYNAGNK